MTSKAKKDAAIAAAKNAEVVAQAKLDAAKTPDEIMLAEAELMAAMGKEAEAIATPIEDGGEVTVEETGKPEDCTDAVIHDAALAIARKQVTMGETVRRMVAYFKVDPVELLMRLEPKVDELTPKPAPMFRASEPGQSFAVLSTEVLADSAMAIFEARATTPDLAQAVQDKATALSKKYGIDEKEITTELGVRVSNLELRRGEQLLIENRAAALKKHDSTKVMVDTPREFKLQDNAGRMITFPKGVSTQDKSHAEHDYAKANGVRLI